MGGCMGGGKLVSIQSLKAEIPRLKYVCESQRGRKQAQLYKGQVQLVKEFTKQPGLRNKGIEASMIRGNAMLANQRILYMYLQNEAKILQQHRHCFDSLSSMQEYKQSINLILYSAQLFSNQTFINFRKDFITLYPKYKLPQDGDIKNQAAINQKKGIVSFQMEYVYIYEMAQRHGLEMETVNQIGHNYKYGAVSHTS